MQSNLQQFFTRYFPALPGLIFYAINVNQLFFIQDDAYISYRYVANYLNGDGLVYNIGERVEGITNFGWTIMLTLVGTLGFDYVFLSQVIGFLLGAAVIVVTVRLAGKLFNHSIWFTLPAGLLIGGNLSLAYWSPAGLETAAFVLVSLLSLYLFSTRNWLVIATLTLAVWLRPEGAFVAGLLIVIEAIVERRLPLFMLRATGMAFIFSLPFVFFKLSYYGSILPNPFFAKTSFTILQISDGLEYASRYFSHYGFYGVTLAIPLLFYRNLSRYGRELLIFVLLYICYVILIGGDVLKVHRFFLPIFGPAAVLTVLSVSLITASFRKKQRKFMPIIVCAPLAALSFWLPFNDVTTFNVNEKLFTHKQRTLARKMKASDNRKFSVALPTIGIFGYELVGHRIIDMLGLTDTTIARHSEEPIKGMETTWKEQKHNSAYLLRSQPDYIVFSTGMKPSAPAERALLLYRPFLDAYRFVGWKTFRPIDGRPYVMNALKRMKPVIGDLVPSYPIEYIQLYKTGQDLFAAGRLREAISYFDKALAFTPEPPNPYISYQKAHALIGLKQHPLAKPLLDSIIFRDSLVYQAHRELFFFELILQNEKKAAIHMSWLKRLVPWMIPEYEANARKILELRK